MLVSLQKSIKTVQHVLAGRVRIRLEWIKLVLSVNSVDFIANLLDSFILIRLVLPEGHYDFSLDADEQSVSEVSVVLDSVEVEEAEGDCIPQR